MSAPDTGEPDVREPDVREPDVREPDVSQPQDDGYDGPAELLVDGRDDPVAVRVALRGHFDPISGHYGWYGRVAAGPEVADLLASGTRSVVLRTPYASAGTQLRDVDPWGRPRVEGFGPAPFPVLTTVATDPSGGG